MRTIRVKSAEAVFRAHADPKSGLAQALIKGIVDGGRRGKAHLVRKSRAIVDLGEFWNSWFDPIQKGATITVRNDAPHAGIIEAGARPHGVSEEGREALLDWVLRNVALVPFSPRAVSDARRSRRADVIITSPRVAERAWGVIEAARAVVHGIVMKIKHHGVEGHWIVRDALPQLQKLAELEAERALRKALEAVPGAKA